MRRSSEEGLAIVMDALHRSLGQAQTHTNAYPQNPRFADPKLGGGVVGARKHTLCACTRISRIATAMR
jgi:hypothetical protein